MDKTIQVRVIPRSGRDDVKESPGGIKAYLNAAPEQGKANKALAGLLAEYFGVKRSQVAIITGARSRDKTVRIKGVMGIVIFALAAFGLLSTVFPAAVSGYDESAAKKRLAEDPEDHITLTELGEACWRRNKRKAALSYLRRAVSIAPDYPYARFLLGRAYFFERKFKEADLEFAAYVKMAKPLVGSGEIAPGDHTVRLHEISYLYTSQKRYDKMAKILKEILYFEPDDQAAHYNLAICYYRHYRNRPMAYEELRAVARIDDTTIIAERARYFLDYMRRNPDPRFAEDISFIDEDH